MARIRTIKPEFFTSEDIVSLTPLARLFYVSLWCESDREGRLEWKPRTFKLRYLPADSCEIEDLALELSNAGLIVLYEVDGKKYAEIPTFGKHQVINNRETQSTLPPRPSTRESGVKDASARVQAEGRKGRKEGKGLTRESERDESPVADAPAQSPEITVLSQKPLTVVDLVGEGVDRQHASDWLKTRKDKRAPLTQTAWEAVRREADAVGISPAEAVRVAAENGWQGFKASWYTKLIKDGGQTKSAGTSFAGVI